MFHGDCCFALLIVSILAEAVFLSLPLEAFAKYPPRLKRLLVSGLLLGTESLFTWKRLVVTPKFFVSLSLKSCGPKWGQMVAGVLRQMQPEHNIF